MIRADSISLSVGSFRLQRLSIEVETGQYFVLLGPPGAGKSVFLECICGLRRVNSGKMYIDERNVTDLEPSARQVGYVPQDYALFPHLPVEGNIAFGLRSHGHSSDEVAARVSDMADLLGIGHLLSRRVEGLSGGEKQRVALARALVLRPKVLLLDEPVCALDEVMRQDVCAQLLRIHRQLGLTTVHVSHNLEEAFSVADRAGILRDGVLQQVGSLDELLRRPESEFVARFVRCENILGGEAEDCGADGDRTQVKIGQASVRILGRHDGKVKIMIRPENVLVVPRGTRRRDTDNEFHLKLTRWRDCGGYVRLWLDGPLNLVAHLTHAAFTELGAGSGADLAVILRPGKIHVLPK